MPTTAEVLASSTAAAKSAAASIGGTYNEGVMKNGTVAGGFEPGRNPPAPRVNPANITTSGDNTSGLNTQSQAEFNAGRKLTPEEVSGIADAYTARLQRETDTINKSFNDRIATQKELGATEDARARVLNSRTGNIDSGTGSTALDTVAKKEVAAEGSIENQRLMSLQGLSDKIDALQKSELDKATAKKSNDSTAYNNMRTANVTTADSIIKGYASDGGVTLEDLQSEQSKKNPNDPNDKTIYDTIREATGWSPLEIATKFNSYKPVTKQIQYTYKADANGNVFAYGKDPETGQVVTHEENIPGLQPGDEITTDAKGNLLIKTMAGSYKTPAQVKDASTKTVEGNITQADADALKGHLMNGFEMNGVKYAPVGSDGYVDASAYAYLSKEWVKQGGTYAGFAKEFPPKDYVNPEGKSLLPAYLQNLMKGTSTSSSTGA